MVPLTSIKSWSYILQEELLHPKVKRISLLFTSNVESQSSQIISSIQDHLKLTSVLLISGGIAKCLTFRSSKRELNPSRRLPWTSANLQTRRSSVPLKTRNLLPWLKPTVVSPLKFLRRLKLRGLWVHNPLPLLLQMGLSRGGLARRSALSLHICRHLLLLRRQTSRKKVFTIIRCRKWGEKKTVWGRLCWQ